MATDMTQGNIFRQLLGFSIPLVVGNMFQLTYNAADSVVVGQFVGKDALAAVGTSGAVVNIVTFFIVGICLGASVLMSEFYGAGKKEKFQKEIATSLWAGLLFTAAAAGAGFFAVPQILAFMRTPAQVMDTAIEYLRIIFLGLPFCFLYNLLASALRSVGDSKTPLLFLAGSSILNIGLDLLLVGAFSMGTGGAAWATIFSQMVSALFCLGYIYKKAPLLRPWGRIFYVDRFLLKRTISYSWASGMQQICLYVGKFLIQGMVNTQGVNAMAAFNGVNRIDDFVFQPQQSIAAAMTTFLAQNRGAGKKGRMKKGVGKAFMLEGIYWLFIGTVIFSGAVWIMGLFVSAKEGEDVIRNGSLYLRLMCPMYVLPGATNSLQGYFRGMGNMRMTLLCTFTQIVFRVGAAAFLIPAMGLVGAAFANLTGWIAMLALEIPFFLRSWKQEMAAKA